MSIKRSDKLVRGRPAWEWGWRNGVRFAIRRTENGSTCEATCHCLGLPGKTHSTADCPNRKAVAA